MVTFGLLVLRLFVGLQLASHGLQKLFGLAGAGGLRQTAASMEQVGFRPGAPFAVAAALGELGGGLLLAMGLLTPFGVAAVIGVMLTATLTAHAGKSFFAHQGGFELPMLLAVVAASLGFTGPGAASVDVLLGWRFGGAVSGGLAIVVGVSGAALALVVRAWAHHELARSAG